MPGVATASHWVSFFRVRRWEGERVMNHREHALDARFAFAPAREGAADVEQVMMSLARGVTRRSPNHSLDDLHAGSLHAAINELEQDIVWTRREERIEHAVSRVHASVVKVADGTGVVISGRGHILTAHHVVHGSNTSRVTVTMSDGTRAVADIVAFSRHRDLALLQLTDRSRVYTSATLTAGQARSGDTVVVVGHPDKSSGRGDWHASIGSVLTARGGARDSMRHDAWTFWGHSGAPIFDETGRLIGIHRAWSPDSGERVGISAAQILGFLADVEAGRDRS